MRPLPDLMPGCDRRTVMRVPQQPLVRIDRNHYSIDRVFAGRRVEVGVSQREVTAVVLSASATEPASLSRRMSSRKSSPTVRGAVPRSAPLCRGSGPRLVSSGSPSTNGEGSVACLHRPGAPAALKSCRTCLAKRSRSSRISCAEAVHSSSISSRRLMKSLVISTRPASVPRNGITRTRSRKPTLIVAMINPPTAAAEKEQPAECRDQRQCGQHLTSQVAHRHLQRQRRRHMHVIRTLISWAP
jgi:hypothetical protein